ncbi:tetratricopeptide repeat protein [Echinicola jeungdonensis]|uniref:Tetratricopeptide repeat protein n=1 Tax=Echinicola jeungdonensis TaxID=709343 RepID=A0ABV5J710_9BACT|nr:tetratricopeptide repeat protein [Echinicola jeungdonensis]MDN3670747.1 tetratricopeptide repeat protein [Echinicola jeungdonensis]
MLIKQSILGLLLSAALLWGCGKSGNSAGDTLYAEGNYQQAVEAYSEQLKNYPKNEEVLYRRGRAYEELGNLEEAIADFEAAVKLDSKNTKFLLGLSNLYQKQGKHERALLFADRAVEVPGAPATAYFMRARALHQIGSTNEALKEYNNTIKMDQNYGQAFYYRGVLKYATKDRRGACVDLKQAETLGYNPATKAIEKYCQ